MRKKSALNPRNELLPVLRCEVGVYSTQTSDRGEQIIGEKLFKFPAYYGTSARNSEHAETPRKKSENPIAAMFPNVKAAIDTISETIEKMETKNETDDLVEHCADKIASTLKVVFQQQ